MSNVPRVLIRKRIYPCFDCVKRHVGCHSTCKAYKAQRAKEIELWKEAKKRQRGEADADEYEIKSKEKTIKRQRRLR